MSEYHVPIMPAEVLELLNAGRKGIFVDGTLGGGGHSCLIFKEMLGGSTLVGIDRDVNAINEASSRIMEVKTAITGSGASGKEFLAIRGNFFDMKQLLSAVSINAADGILLDLGVSSRQLDDPSRGFSYMHNAPLDMRMDTDAGLTAETIVNDYDEERLYELIRDYGEERYAYYIAKQIVKARTQKRITETLELVDIIKRAMPKKSLQEKQHPAKRTFQAIRIETNSELNGLKEAVEHAADLLNVGGRLAIITFHSLEDRIVKQAFVKMEKPCICDPRSPICTCNRKPTAKVLTRKPVVATETELETNPRARSAKLRAIERVSTT